MLKYEEILGSMRNRYNQISRWGNMMKNDYYTSTKLVQKYKRKKYTNTKVHNYTITQLCEYTSTHKN